MNLRAADDGAARFSAYIEGLVSVIGHADRNMPLRDYCVGLMLPCDRKSVEPMAARTAPERTSAQHQKLLHFVGVAAWSDEKVMAKIVEMVLPAIEHEVRLKPGLSMTRAFPRRGSIRLAWRGNIAGSSASRTIVRWRCRYRSAIAMRACRSPTDFTCRKIGPPTANVVTRRACLTTSSLRPNPRLRLRRSKLPARPASRAASCCWMPAMAATLQHCASRWHRCAWSALCRRHHAADKRVAIGHGAAAAEEVVWPGKATQTHPPRRQEPSDLGQGACAWIAETSLAYDQVARGHERCAVLALCAGACASSASRL